MLVEKQELYKHFIYSDGGRWASKVQAVKNKEMIGDCPVRSIVHATGIDYNKAFNVMRRFGWRTFIGWNNGRMHDFLTNRFVFGYDIKPVSTWGRGKTTTVKQFVESTPQGTYLLRVHRFDENSSHIFCVRNGKIFDTFAEDAWVTQAYKVTEVVDI